MSGSATRHQRQIPHGSGEKPPDGPRPFSRTHWILSAQPWVAGWWRSSSMLSMAPPAPPNSSAISTATSVGPPCSVAGWPSSSRPWSAWGQHLVCRGQHDDCHNHGNRADGEGHVKVEGVRRACRRRTVPVRLRGSGRTRKRQRRRTARQGGHHHCGLGGQCVVDPDEDPGGDHRDDQEGRLLTKLETTARSPMRTDHMAHTGTKRQIGDLTISAGSAAPCPRDSNT
jgi:hypothetical protein